MFPKTVFISGANRGLGLEFIKQLVKNQNPPKFIFACCRDPPKALKLETVKVENDFTHIEILKLNLHDPESIKNATTFATAVLKDEKLGLNLLINNAGIMKPNVTNPAKFGTLENQNLFDHFQTNVIAPLLVIQGLHESLKIAGESNKEGIISEAGVINLTAGLASFSAKMNGAQLTGYPYHLSKTALNMMSFSLAKEFKRDNITVCGVYPGWTSTKMGGPKATYSPEESVKNILTNVLPQGKQFNGLMLDYNGKVVSY